MKQARRRLLLIVGLALTASACTEVDPAGPVRGTFPNRSYRPEAHAAVAAFRRDLARALGDVALRRAVHRALQRSQLQEYKVRLDEFLAAEDGRVLVNALATSTGRSADQVERMMAALPRLQLYIPMSVDRRS